MKTDLENISVKDFLAIQDEELFKDYLEIKNLMKPRGEFCGFKAKPLGELRFGQVANLKETFSDQDAPLDAIFEAFNLVFGVKKKTYLAADVVSYFYALNWITEELRKLIEIENKVLAADPDPLLEMAGADRLAVFKELPVLQMIGKHYGTPPQEVETWTYNLIFSLLLLEKRQEEVRERYQQIKNSKNGSKG